MAARLQRLNDAIAQRGGITVLKGMSKDHEYPHGQRTLD